VAWPSTCSQKGGFIYKSKTKGKTVKESEDNFEYSYQPDFHCHSFVWLLKLRLSPHNFHPLPEVSLIGQTPEDQQINKVCQEIQ